MDEAPQTTLDVAIELEEVVATAEGAEVAASERLAGMFQRPGRER
jgi:hypothetical protein